MKPTRTALLALSGMCLLGVAVALWPWLETPFWVAGGALWVAGLADALTLFRQPAPTLQRELPASLALGQRYEVSLVVHTGRPEQVVVHDHCPSEGVSDGTPIGARLHATRPTRLGYSFVPRQRGKLTFEPASVIRTGPLRMLQRCQRAGEASAVQVYPNFRRAGDEGSAGEISQYHGVRLERRRGQGLEFHQLREYRDGDSLRDIDWRSVARRHKLIAREYQSERNQHVVFLVDCGRRMRAHDGDLSLLDQSLNALMLLTYVALRQGDSVGVLSFSGIDRWLPPVRGPGGLRHVLQSVYDLGSTPQPSDFEAAVRRLSAQQRRRALIVVLTNLGDDTSGLHEALLPLGSRHLVLVASLRDPELTRLIDRPVRHPGDAEALCSTLAYLDARHAARRKLMAQGVETFESEPAELPHKLVEHYLRIKRAGRL